MFISAHLALHDCSKRGQRAQHLKLVNAFALHMERVLSTYTDV